MSFAAATLVVASVGMAGTLTLGVELAYCYVPSAAPLNDTPLCGPYVWGHTAVPFLLLALSAALTVAWLVGGIGTGISQVWRAAAFRRRLLTARVDHPAAHAPSVEGHTVVVADTDVPVAITVGVVRPRIVVTTAVIDALDDRELAAVLCHEAHHAEQRDPALYAVARAAVNALLYLPAVRGWAARAQLEAEIAADQHAIERVGRCELVSALKKLDAAERDLGDAAIGSIHGMMDGRIRALAGKPIGPAYTRSDLRRSVAGAAVASMPLVGLLAAVSRTQ